MMDRLPSPRKAASITIVLAWAGLASLMIWRFAASPAPAPAEIMQPPLPAPSVAEPETLEARPVSLPPPPAPAPAPAPPPSPAPASAAAPAPAPTAAPAAATTAAPAAEAPPPPVAALQTPPEPEPPPPIKQVMPLRASPAAPASAPAPKPIEPTARTVAVTPQADDPQATDGRVLLRLLEHGAGPRIEIGWPAAAQRAALYDRLMRCYGMMNGLILADGRLYREADPPGIVWQVDTDRISGFLRQPDGFVAASERNAAGRIRAHHDLGSQGLPVRLFPRLVDAALLGGLDALAGGTAKAKIVQGYYEMTGGLVSVGRISVDGRAIAGRVALGALPGSGCR